MFCEYHLKQEADLRTLLVECLLVYWDNSLQTHKPLLQGTIHYLRYSFSALNYLVVSVETEFSIYPNNKWLLMYGPLMLEGFESVSFRSFVFSSYTYSLNRYFIHVTTFSLFTFMLLVCVLLSLIFWTDLASVLISLLLLRILL